jgi:hypothetical protein
MMLEIAFQCFFDDLVVPVVLAFVLKSTQPCVGILQFRARNDLGEPVGDRNGIAIWHKKNENDRPNKPFEQKKATSLPKLRFSQSVAQKKL